MQVQAILFDLDGTLLDTLEDLGRSMNAVLEARGLEPHSLEAYKGFVGDGIVKLAIRALPEVHRDERTIADCVAEMRKEYADRWDQHTRPYDGVESLLHTLARKDVRLTIFSNKPHDFTELCVKRFLAPFPFDAVLGIQEGIAPKPDPQGALHICQTVDLSPETFLYVGDTNTDMTTAKRAGMFPVGAVWGFRSALELEQSGARRLIHHPLDLLDLLEEI